MVEVLLCLNAVLLFGVLSVILDIEKYLKEVLEDENYY